MSIHINKLLPKGVKIVEFRTGSELILAYELGKYTQLLLKEELSVKGISVHEDLKKTGHFKYVLQSKKVTDLLYNGEKLVKFNYGDYLLGDEYVTNVHLKNEDQSIIFNINSDEMANEEFTEHVENRSAAYVSLVAFVLVKNYYDQNLTRKLVIDHEDYDQKNDEYKDIIELQKSGILPKTILEIKFKSQGLVQLPWQNFVQENRDNKLMNKEYFPEEKYSFLQNNKIEVGDVVLLYTRDFDKAAVVNDTIGTLKSCFPAVIEDYDEKRIVLRYYRIIETKLTQRARIKDLIDNNKELDDLFPPTIDQDRTRSDTITLLLSQIGVGTCTYLEETFILEPVEGDNTTQLFIDKKGNSFKITLNTLETIYAVFEDRGIEYNRNKFLQGYFKGKTPKFDEYKQRRAE